MKRFLRLPSPAMMVALLALFAALAGTSYAAVTITGKNVKNSSLTGSDVKNGSLTGPMSSTGRCRARTSRTVHWPRATSSRAR